MDFENWINILSCPVCHGELHYNHFSFSCFLCERSFPVHFGFPDFRLFPPNALGYISQEKDLEISSELSKFKDKISFEELVRLKISREADYSRSNLNEIYINWRLDGHDRALQLGQFIRDQGLLCKETKKHSLGLDIGCGSGSGMATLLEVQDSAVGLDISISELILAECFLKKHYPNRNILLFAGVSEHLPLTNELFTLVIARDVIEHVGNQKKFFLEAYRVMRKNRYFLLNTGSRYVFIEPHTRLLGVGYLPRFLQPIFVRLIRNRPYKIHLPSLWELRKWLRKSPFGNDWKIFPSTNINSAMRIAKKRSKIAHLMLKILNKLGLANILNSIFAHISYYEIIMKK